ncbi:MAG: hypothetical protein ABIE07_09160, partial [Candidatus Zixiibacteriota bacterium]
MNLDDSNLASEGTTPKFKDLGHPAIKLNWHFLMIIIAALSDHRIQKREQKKTMIDLFNKKCYLSARINLL